MAKETQKEKIERLEKSLNNANNIIQQLNNEISDMVDKADESFENSSTYKQMLKQIETLEMKIKAITDTADHNRKMYNNELKRNSELIKEIQELKNEDYTLEDIKELEQKIQNARKNSDKWHTEYFNKDMKYKELDKKYNELKANTDKLKAKNKKLKLKEEVLEEVLKRVKELEKENEELKSSCINPMVTKKHNERGAGRKARFTDTEIETIKMYRIQGKTIKEIADMFKCSVGLVHKIINEKQYLINNNPVDYIKYTIGLLSVYSK